MATVDRGAGAVADTVGGGAVVGAEVGAEVGAVRSVPPDPQAASSTPAATPTSARRITPGSYRSTPADPAPPPRYVAAPARFASTARREPPRQQLRTEVTMYIGLGTLILIIILILLLT